MIFLFLFSDMNLMGLEINLVWLVLIFFTIYMVIFSFMINVLEPLTPKIISDAFGYGKTTNANLNRLVRLIQVPKAWFLHFYIFAVFFMAFLLSMVIKVVVLSEDLPQYMSIFLDFFTNESRIAGTTPEGILLAMILLNIQCARRLYECLYINVNSGSKMNILHYIVGFAHYFCTGVGYISESPGFSSHFAFVHWVNVVPQWSNFQWKFLLCIAIFAYAWYHQFQTHKIFAQLKRQHSTHSVPHGSLFTYVSCPHYLCEILIYLSLALILGFKHQTAWLIFTWVLINQVIAGLMSHWWYRKNFHNYPTKRKAIIPCLL